MATVLVVDDDREVNVTFARSRRQVGDGAKTSAGATVTRAACGVQAFDAMTSRPDRGTTVEAQVPAAAAARGGTR